MRVLAIDPGYDRMGVAILETDKTNDVLIHSECIETNKKDSPADRLLSIGLRLEELFHAHAPNVVAIETLFFNKNQKTAMQVAEARGVVVYLAKKFNCDVKEFGPKMVKLAVTGYGASDKKSVTTMLSHLVKNLPKKALDDEYDAIAIGITALHTRL